MSELALLDSLPPLSGQARVEALEKLTNTTVQDNDHSDTAVIAVCISMLSLTFMFLSYTWLNRSYRPIRAKSLTLCTLMYLASVMWVIGDFQMNGLVRIRGGWKLCKFWVVWIRILGSYIYSSLLMLRFIALDRIFNRGKPYRGRAAYLPAIGLFLVLLAYCLACQLVPTKDVSIYVNYVQICMVNNTFRYASVGLMWIPWSIVLVLAFRLRNIQGSFNERYESLFTIALAYLILIKTTIVHAVHPYYIFNKGLRHAETLIDGFASALIIWLMLGYPVFHCAFNRDRYEKQWLLTLRTDGQADKYSVDIKSTPENTTAYSQLGSYYNQKTSEYAQGDPMGTIRMLSQNKTLIEGVSVPQRTYGAPNVDFGDLEMRSDLSLESGVNDPSFARRII
ncbi:hypothetical protein GGI25_004163 [Coemansia spiralis]|uniref:G-protein coupled receptors family 3 profile domain-containing protein n=2 Tax=Coemansia TaxID=4863 RepID=A0A9W8G6P9_9FUNG|nr:hypothetical protein EDC05_005611 [Coemansia umbellata]KAJ2620486.1 hypothetical protein GGI26_004974 [Coemansia sp. RSA 1358]KAJ2675015.1 hypothetical protein GGI25_004163 [Coemansia spiralis]